MNEALEPLQAVQLFGGAAEIALPSRFADVSNVRPVPDNQEVYTDANIDQSLIVEIVEHVDVPDSDSAQHCFNDLASVSGAGMQQIESEAILSPQDMPGVPPEAYKAIVVGQQLVSKGRQASHAANRVQVILAIIRLKQVSSEVLITLNTPVSVSSSSAAAQDIGAGESAHHYMAPSLMRRVIATFKINDYSLFG
ncbi:probable ran guanine nucleotide release factor [Coccomyxa sp. Obi]|nr:probable ran guanine nucleotide release factor [Coccomyxa sp. Obi]